MSNRTLKERIAEAIRRFETGDIGLAALKSAVLDNGSALEAMPYTLIKEMEELEHQLTIAQFHDQDGELSPEEALGAVKAWFGQLPD